MHPGGILIEFVQSVESLTDTFDKRIYNNFDLLKHGPQGRSKFPLCIVTT